MMLKMLSNVMLKNITYIIMYLSAAINDIADNGPPEIAWDSIAPTIEQDNVEAANDDTVTI